MLRLSEVVAAQKQVQGLYRVAKSGRNGANGVSNGMCQRIPSWINLASMGGAHLIPIPVICAAVSSSSCIVIITRSANVTSAGPTVVWSMDTQ